MDFITILAIVSTALTVISIWLAILFYWRGKRKRELTWHVEHQSPIESNIPGLKITFNDKKISSLKPMLLTIENTGNSDITREDIMQAILFSTGLEQEQFLNARLLDEHAKKPNEFEVVTNETSIEFRFKFIGKKDHVQIHILHTAEENPVIKFATNGRVIKDGKILNKAIIKLIRRSIRYFLLYIFIIGLFIGAIISDENITEFNRNIIVIPFLVLVVCAMPIISDICKYYNVTWRIVHEKTRRRLRLWWGDKPASSA